MSVTPEMEKHIRQTVVAACDAASHGMVLGERLADGFLDAVDLSVAAAHMRDAAEKMAAAYRVVVDAEDPPMGEFA